MSNDQRFYAAANANVLDGATEVQCKLARSALTKLKKSEVAKPAAKDHLESHQSGMDDKLSRKTIRKLWNGFEILKQSPRAMKSQKPPSFGS